MTSASASWGRVVRAAAIDPESSRYVRQHSAHARDRSPLVPACMHAN